MVQDINNTGTAEKTASAGQDDPANDEKRKKVGNYIILKTIGEGSFAKVRLGIHLITEMKVAVKVINKREVFKRNYLRSNLRREASMMQRLSHSNIVQLHEVMETENSYYIVMDLVEGDEFVKYLTKQRQLTENETRKYIRQIVSAVDHMHRAQVIHRDIKLQNFMLDENYDIIIIDFGLSNCLDEKGFLTTQCGSPAYAAPEIFAHQEYGPAVDIWSIGVNMYAMLLGKLPFKVEHRSRNLAKLHACILKGCEIPNSLSRDCHDLLSRLLEPSPAKRISMQEILRHPFLIHQLGPIELTPYKPHADERELDRNILKYLAFKHGYSEQDVEEAVMHRKPIAARALYSLIERRLKEGLGWPDRTYNNSAMGLASTTDDGAIGDGPSEIAILEKLDRRESLLPARRNALQQATSLSNNASKLSREKSHYAFDEQVLLRTNVGTHGMTSGLTQEALNELVPASRQVPRRMYPEIMPRRIPPMGSSAELLDEYPRGRPGPYSGGLSPIKPSVSTHRLGDHRNNILILQQRAKMKPRSLPSSTLDHANQNGFHLPYDPYLSRTPKNLSRTSYADQSRRTQQQSPLRYNPTPSVTVKAIGLLLKNSTLHSRVSSCSSRSSKEAGGGILDAQPPSPPSKYQPSNVNTKKAMINYHQQGHLSPSSPPRQAFVNPNGSPHHLTTKKISHKSPTATSRQKLMPISP